VYEAPIHVVDLYPTLIGLAGGSLEQPLPLDGVDVWASLADGAPAPRDEFLVNASPAQSALRSGRWKLVARHGRRAGPPTLELFDLVADPSEEVDLSGAHPQRVAELHERLRAYEAQAAPPLKPGPMPKGFRGPPVWGVFERVEAPGSDG
jgi:arylsulfatase A-like enzyme